eukprot:TRINITY_DN20151_c0_g1_i1.p1 TRINITY_DN20151_c0_g1~~TRINITY_DN20151_c0_g1_i1.p1  ORF type:complete len:878 (-),score=86.91 TRINITY_DN20151_c0_g1_i1:586-3219(-)
MSLAEISSPNSTATIDRVQHRLDRISSKRKLDDYGPSDDDLSSFPPVRMKKDDPIPAVDSYNGTKDTDFGTRVSVPRSVHCTSSNPTLHFFVRMISGGNTVVIHANRDDTVESVHEQIQRITGIPINEQRLIYRGKQLQWDRSLGECSVQNDAGLQLVGRMRSTEYPKAWRIVNDVISSVCRLCRGDSLLPCRIIGIRIREFLMSTPRDDMDMASGHLRTFKLAGAPSALVMLFLSPIKGNRECAEESIRLFLRPNGEYLPEYLHTQCAPIVLEFCKLLTRTSHEHSLYLTCRNTLGSLLETLGIAHGSRHFEYANSSTIIRELFPFVNELASRLSVGLETALESSPMSAGDAHDFSSFLLPLRRAIEDRMSGRSLIRVPLDGKECEYSHYEEEIGSLHGIFQGLLDKIDQCLKKMEEILVRKKGSSSESESRWYHYLAVLKDLNGVSKLYEGAEEKLHSVCRARKFSLNFLIKQVKRSDDHRWILDYKDVTDFESRRHLVMMLFPEVKHEYGALHEMLIDRSQLLVESFRYISSASRDALHAGLFMEFKNEEATGPGVLREWFCLVCRAIFNPQNALFLACPNDRRRFFPNPASNVDPLHLDYFVFCGRVIALALMHKVHVGVVFDRVFFLQLAGKFVSLEDVRDADPYLYMSCKKILEMDPNFLDSDALGLTFVREYEELGTLKVVELCPGGKGIIVNSSNRQEYVNLLIQHCFVTSISEQVSCFAQGFADILSNSKLQKFFFQSLELEDLNHMLYGSDRAICVKDWKAHTEYNGYKETDRQICWFWKAVESMSDEQRRVLLFFWTSVNYLPVEGFGGLASKLYIYKTVEGHDRLPSSHTCFYRLCLPPYPSKAVTVDRLRIITQEHVSCSFGTW